ncbi:MAG TPA: beta-ketoacyl-[acyl-carrier-protein] synthase family protein [Candidatus Wunengus sp. YC61]|uniref:beta-ketoacyl-[acyl-carrier-protein] synthase family protein n=1 Tax=Candidatus Wunengus sp. YC61 TaxID=3367698 RepID=UPI00402743EF
MSQDSAVKEVVITGVGVVTPLEHGKGTQSFWNSLCSGANAIKPIHGFDVKGHKCNVGGEISGFESFLKDYWKKEQNRCTKLFALACQYALQDAVVDSSLMQTMGVAVGNILGDMVSGEKYMNERFFLTKKTDYNLLRQYCLHAVADSITQGFSMHGPAVSINTACCSGADAIRSAASQIRNGRVNIMIAGGVDILSEFVFRGFSALNALTTDGKVRPFDRGRKGLALGEGAGVVVLEERSHADKRGAKMYCRLLSSGSSSDAYNLVKPHEEGQGLSRAISAALLQAKGEIDSVDYVCAHGTGTLHNDNMETKAIKQAFGEKAYTIKISSIKSMIGHTLGAASAIEAVNCAKVIETNTIPPTINYEEPDPECDLQYVVNVAAKATINKCMSLSAGFGGQNTALIFSRIQS